MSTMEIENCETTSDLRSNNPFELVFIFSF